MALVKALGANLQTGVSTCGVTGVYEQSGTKDSAGELIEIKSAAGSPVSVYVRDRHKEYSFEAVLSQTVQDKNVGDRINVNGQACVVTKWSVIESNDDVKKVSIGCRNYEGLSS